MNESEFRERWESEKPIYGAWGEYVVNTITQSLIDKGKDLDVFLKTPAKYRLKDDKSLVDKAFYRPDKNYTDPYNQIEDKVGARFIVLLLNDIKEICDSIEGNKKWCCTNCKHFEQDREKDPLLFTYQSVHYIIRPTKEMVLDGIIIPTTTPCEVQIRTLLQHAHAELTHDAIYKSKRTVRPKVHRTVAKSMALIETTDDFFTEVTQFLNYGPLEEYNVLDRLDGIYFSNIGIKSHTQKSSIILWDVFETFINDNLVDNIQDFLTQNDFLSDLIKNKYSNNSLYQQSTILFVYWMLRKKKKRLLQDWPFSMEILEALAVDLGISIVDD